MRIEIARPPNYEAIIALWPHVARTYGVLFCYGDVIFNRDGVSIHPATHAHEEIHSIRQEAQGGPEGWWERYLADPAFRFNEELHAHIVEYRKTLDDSRSRNERRFYLNQIAERLAGPLYGRLVTIEKAKRLLKHGAEILDPKTGEAA